MEPIIDHIQITVKNMKVAEPFYDKLMPILGFNLEDKISAVIEEHDLYVVEYLNESFDFGICSPRTAFKGDTIHRRKPDAFHHMAFRAKSRKEVDELFLRIKEIGANIVYAPQIFEEHGPYYYAMFFKDLEGIKYEIVYNKLEGEVV